MALTQRLHVVRILHVSKEIMCLVVQLWKKKKKGKEKEKEKKKKKKKEEEEEEEEEGGRRRGEATHPMPARPY